MHYSRVIQVSFKALCKPGLQPQYTRGCLGLYQYGPKHEAAQFPNSNTGDPNFRVKEQE
jgi:hypothetical protein